ncbi:CoA transferase subunit A [Evansella halocellulosilytica]|uniref:CoA transferase subunit A n=1 Tax=Evansella halocellulosilytica TaxID=2011013 RepID=UPI000BB8C4CE|nr:CoA-transferase [Evansella halocellulosilytica]
MGEIMTIREAVRTIIQDGDSIALEGFTHLIPHGAAQEIIRQQKQDLTLIRLTPDIIYDQMIGMGVVKKLVFSWGGNPGVGSLHRFRDAVEKSWPRALDIEEHTHAGLANRYIAGAQNLPFAVLKGYRGTDLLHRTENVALIECPFTGERVTAVKAIHPDVTIIHAQQADRQGNVQMWGIVGIQKEAAFAANRVIVTVEEVVDELIPKPHSVFIPASIVHAVSVVPNGTYPSYALDYSNRDNEFYKEWDGISRDRDTYKQWMEQYVLDSADFSEFLHKLKGVVS